jgi:hypothetical protein
VPKLDGTHIASRLRERLEELREGKEVAPRDLRALLTKEQEAAMDAAWTEQQALRKKKRARTKEEEAALGWRTKRDIHIEAYENAIEAADDAMLATLEELLRKAEVRGARIFLETFSQAMAAGKTEDVAKNLANNELTRAGLRRTDGRQIGFISRRDREIWEMEEKIRNRIRSEMTQEELEQIELWEAHEKALREKGKKLGM